MAVADRSDARQGETSLRLQNGFVLLWFAWALLLAGALALGAFGGHGSAGAVAGRMGSSVALVVAAWFAYAVWRRATVGAYALAIALGMTAGAIGDFFNADLLRFVPLQDPVLGGIAAFALGHIAYIAGCLYLARRADLGNRTTMAAAIVAWQLIGLVGWYFVAYEGSEARGLVWPALPYSLLLAGTAGVTSGLALQDARFAALAVGGALFLASDLILACGMFRGQVPYQTIWVWLTYGPAQMLIVYSVLRAAAMLRERVNA